MTRLAVVPVRDATLPAGGVEAVADAGGRALVVGDGARAAARSLGGVATELRCWDTPGYAPGAWAGAIAPLVADETLLVLPASPDGRDLAPRLAALLERPLFAAAMELGDDTVTTIRHGGRVLAEHQLGGPAVVTLQPGVRGVEPAGPDGPEPQMVEVAQGADVARRPRRSSSFSPRTSRRWTCPRHHGSWAEAPDSTRPTASPSWPKSPRRSTRRWGRRG
ncbi:MAG: hypothetical protein V9E94_01615 [Microthrixaceae bacterium]